LRRVSARIGSACTSAPRPAQADSTSAAQRAHVQRHALAAVGDEQFGSAAPAPGDLLARALLRAALAVQHVGARHLVVATAHQAQLDMVLHVLDVEGAAARPRAQQRAHHGLGQPLDRLAHARRCRALRAVHGQEGLHQGHRDLVRLERDHRAVAADDLVARVGAGRRRAWLHGNRGRLAEVRE
jgi:hypothetical protein